MSSNDHDRPDRQSPNVLTDGAWVMGTDRVLIWVTNAQAIEQDRLDVHPLIACPTCHARIDQSCRTRTGRRRSPHLNRLVVRRCTCGEPIQPRRQVCDDCRAEANRAHDQRRSQEFNSRRAEDRARRRAEKEAA